MLGCIWCYMMAHRSCFNDMMLYMYLVTGSSQTISFALYTKNDVLSSLSEWVLHTAPFSILSPSLLTIVAQSLKRNIGKSACVTKSATAIQSNLVKKINNQFGCLDDKPLPVCIQIMWLKLCRNDFRRVSDRLNRCIESTSACFESPYMEMIVNGFIYSTPGVVKHRVT